MAISPQQLKIYLTSAHRAVIFAIAQLSCFCDAPTDRPLLGSKAAENRYPNLLLTSFVYILEERVVPVVSNKHAIFERKGGGLLVATFVGVNYHDRRSIAS